MLMHALACLCLMQLPHPDCQEMQGPPTPLTQSHTFSLACHTQTLGTLFEAIGQPTINGYLIAGAVVGPGGFQIVKVSLSGSGES